MINEEKIKHALCSAERLDFLKSNEYYEMVEIFKDLAKQVLQAKMPEYRTVLMGSPYSHENAEGFNEAHDLFTALIARDYVHKDEIKAEVLSSDSSKELDKIAEEINKKYS